MEITDILNDLDIAIEGLQGDIGKAAKAISKEMDKKIAEANKAIKKGDYSKASKICSECITKLENLKSQLKDVESGTSMTKLDDLVKGNLGDIVVDNQIMALKSMIKPMLLLLGAIAVSVGINLPSIKKINDINKEIEKNNRIAWDNWLDFDAHEDGGAVKNSEIRIRELNDQQEVIKSKNAPYRFAGSALVTLGCGNLIYQAIKQQLALQRNTLNFKNMNITDLIKIIDVQINSFKAIQKICDSVDRNGHASEAMIDYLTVSMEALYDNSGSVLATLISCGYEDDLVATIYA